MSRSGKHKEGKVRIGIYLDPERKAVAVMLGELTGMSLTDLVWYGIETVAKSRGVLSSEGLITDEFADQYAVALELVKQSEVKS